MLNFCKMYGKRHRPPRSKTLPPRIVSWGLWIFRKKAHGWEDKEKTGRSCLVWKHWGHHWPSISHQTPREMEDGSHEENWTDDVWGSKENSWQDCKSFLINNCNYLCVFCEFLGQICVRYRTLWTSRRHRDRSSPMDVRISWLLPMGDQSTLAVFVLLEPVSS